jgi:hypothetical protein
MNPPIPFYQNFLSIEHAVKPIPYPRCTRPDGAINHGFKPLKGKTPAEIIEAVPEVALDARLASLLFDINGKNSGLFSVGCVSTDFSLPSGCRVGGYVEFVINDKRLAQDEIAYFGIFRRFDAQLSPPYFTQRVQFIWKLRGANFVDSGIAGFSCLVDIYTHDHPDKEAARDCWNKSLEALGTCLKEPIYLKSNVVIITNFDRIY